MTLDSFDELRTPVTNMSEYMTFGLPVEEPKQMKSVEGPVGPHLFRMSQDSARDIDIYLTLSPPASPEQTRPSLQHHHHHHQGPETYREPPRTSVPLRTWNHQQVAEWMFATGFDRSICDTFFINDISGVTLIDLKYEDLKELGITSFGQRHKLWTEIKALKDAKLPLPEEDPFVPTEVPSFEIPEPVERKCESPAEELLSPISPMRRGRRHMEHDLISPAESASIVAIEQLLPKPHSCSKGDACKTRQKYLKKMARIKAEFPHEIQQLEAQKRDNTSSSPVESGLGASIVASVLPSVVASSDVLGNIRPKLRLEEVSLKTVEARDPQESVRQFLNFQHAIPPQEPTTPPYEMFPPLSPPKPAAPHSGLASLPRLQIPAEPAQQFYPPVADRTAVPARHHTPITALNLTQHPKYNSIYRMASPASEMDVPITAFPIGPVQRDFSSSVPPDMRFGGTEAITRSTSRTGHRTPYNFSQPFSPLQRSQSTTGNRPRAGSSFANQMPYLAIHREAEHAPTVLTAPTEFDVDMDDLTPTGTPSPESSAQHAGWMKKRRTKMLRHEWNEHHFRLNGTQLAMHKDETAQEAIESIDVDDYAVAISAANNSKLNAAFKRLHISAGKGKGLDPAAFAFQLTPAADKKGLLHAATGKTHHFAVKTQNERIDWMRELMLARAKKQKDAVCANF